MPPPAVLPSVPAAAAAGYAVALADRVDPLRTLAIAPLVRPG